MESVPRSQEAVSGQQNLTLPANEHVNAVFHRTMMQLAGELLGLVAGLPEWAGVHHILIRPAVMACISLKLRSAIHALETVP